MAPLIRRRPPPRSAGTRRGDRAAGRPARPGARAPRPRRWCGRPARWAAATTHSRWATAPGTSSAPVSPCSSAIPSNFSGPLQAKRRRRPPGPRPARSPRTRRRPRRRRGRRTRRSTQARTSGGSRLTDANALTVSPAGAPAASRARTTVTPVANCDSARRKDASSTGMGGVEIVRGKRRRGARSPRPVEVHERARQRHAQQDAGEHEQLHPGEEDELARVAGRRPGGVEGEPQREGQRVEREERARDDEAWRGGCRRRRRSRRGRRGRRCGAPPPR